MGLRILAYFRFLMNTNLYIELITTCAILAITLMFVFIFLFTDIIV